MLSVLIPIYNYDIRVLVNTLHNQLSGYDIKFEIICIDDFSKKRYNLINSEINNLLNTSLTILNENIGRIAIRQALAQQASYD